MSQGDCGAKDQPTKDLKGDTMKRLTKKELNTVNLALKKIDPLLSLEDGIGEYELNALKRHISIKLVGKLLKVLGYTVVGKELVLK